MTFAPAVSIILPTYNRAHLLARTLQSVQSQTFSDWELIVIGDGSTDETNEIISAYAQKDHRMTFYSNTATRGPAGARNTGIHAARGSLIAFIDSDDNWEPSKLATFVEALAIHKDTVLAGSNYRIADRAGRDTTMKSFVLETMVPWWRGCASAAAVIPCDAINADFSLIARQDLILSMTIAGFLWIHTSSAMVRRDALLRSGAFDERLKRTEDIDLWLKLAPLGPVSYIDQVLATYDITGRDQADGSRYERQDRARTHTPYDETLLHLRLLNRIAGTYQLSTAQSKLLKRRLSASHLRCLSRAFRERRLEGFRHVLPALMAGKERRALFGKIKRRALPLPFQIDSLSAGGDDGFLRPTSIAELSRNNLQVDVIEDGPFERTGRFPHLIRVDTPRPRRIEAYQLGTGHDGLDAIDAIGRMPLSWKLSASLDGISWEILDHRRNVPAWQPDEIRTFSLRQPGIYSRFQFTAEDGAHPEIIRLYSLCLIAPSVEPLTAPIVRGQFWEKAGPFPLGLQFDFTDLNMATVYELSSGPHGADSRDRMPVDWQVLGSQDGMNWSEIDRRRGETDWANNEERRYRIASPGSYRQYRFVFLASAAPIIRLQTLNMYSN